MIAIGRNYLNFNTVGFIYENFGVRCDKVVESVPISSCVSKKFLRFDHVTMTTLSRDDSQSALSRLHSLWDGDPPTMRTVVKVKHQTAVPQVNSGYFSG